MDKIFITGATGFVGNNLCKYLDKGYEFNKLNKNQEIIINESIVIHLAGKAHDFKKTLNSNEYYQVNTQLTRIVYDAFLKSQAKVFITLSSVKAVADKVDSDLSELFIPKPSTHYGKSKFLAEQYILNKLPSIGKRVFILRPSMIHGQGNKGNLNSLFEIVRKGFPWPLGAYDNKRSFCSIENICFIIKELIENQSIPSGIYNVSDDEPISTTEVIDLIAESQGKKAIIWNIPKFIIKCIAKVGDLIYLPLNSEKLDKLTETYVVINTKIKNAINKPLPLSSREGLLKTFESFNKNAQ